MNCRDLKEFGTQSSVMNETTSLDFVLFYSSIPLLVIGLIGNVLVIRIVHKTREMHTPTNFLLANMAVSDVIAVSLWPMYYLEFSEFLCKFLVPIEISILVSCITLTVLAVERYHALLKPFRTGLRLSVDNIKQFIAVIWIASVLICLPEFFLNEWSEQYSTCVGPWTFETNRANKAYVMVQAVITLFQLAIVCFCYGSLIRGLYFTNAVCPETDGERRSEKRKLVITFTLVTAGFFIGYTPTALIYPVIQYGYDEQADKLYSALVGVFDFVFVCSLCFNPVIYAFRSSNFKEGFKRILLCR